MLLILLKIFSNNEYFGPVFSFITFFFQVIDTSGKQMGEFTDVSKVEKFEISEEAYAKRSGKVNFQFSLIYNSQLIFWRLFLPKRRVLYHQNVCQLS